MRTHWVSVFALVLFFSCEKPAVRDICTESKGLLVLMKRAKLLLAAADGLTGWEQMDEQTIALHGGKWEGMVRLEGNYLPAQSLPSELKDLIGIITELRKYGFWSALYHYREQNELVLIYSGIRPNDWDVGNPHVIDSMDYHSHKGKRNYDLLDTCNGVAIFSISRNRIADP